MHEMSNRTPTQFLRHLGTLAGPSVPSDFPRNLWTNRPPPNIQAITATQALVPLNDVAQLVDKIAEVTSSPCVVRVSSSGDDISTLTARIDELARVAASLCLSASHPRSPSQTRRHSRRSSRSAGRSPAPDICWYHRRFKADSHIARRAHAVPLPCRALIHTCHAVPLPCSNSPNC